MDEVRRCRRVGGSLAADRQGKVVKGWAPGHWEGDGWGWARSKDGARARSGAAYNGRATSTRRVHRRGAANVRMSHAGAAMSADGQRRMGSGGWVRQGRRVDGADMRGEVGS